MIPRGLRERRGSMVLFLCLTVIVLLCGVGFFIHQVTRQSYREFRRLDGFLRAVSVAEACYLERLSELSEKPWSERPFKGGSETGEGEWLDGDFEYLLVDGPGPFEADLLVKATAEESDVVLYWRLTADPFTFSPFRQIRSTYFSHESPDTRLDVGSLGALRQRANQVMTDRERNGRWSDGKIAEVGNSTNPNDIARALGTARDREIPNQLAAAQPGGPSLPISERVGPPISPGSLPTLPLPDRNPMLASGGGGGRPGDFLSGLFNGGGDEFDWIGLLGNIFPGLGAIAGGIDTGSQIDNVSEGIDATMQAAADVRGMSPSNPANAGRMQQIQAEIADLEAQAASYEQQLQSSMGGGGMDSAAIAARRSEVMAIRQQTDRIAERATRLRAEAQAL